MKEPKKENVFINDDLKCNIFMIERHFTLNFIGFI